LQPDIKNHHWTSLLINDFFDQEETTPSMKQRSKAEMEKGNTTIYLA